MTNPTTAPPLLIRIGAGVAASCWVVAGAMWLLPIAFHPVMPHLSAPASLGPIQWYHLVVLGLVAPIASWVAIGLGWRPRR